MFTSTYLLSSLTVFASRGGKKKKKYSLSSLICHQSVFSTLLMFKRPAVYGILEIKVKTHTPQKPIA